MKLKDFKLGATGRFPFGKVDETDEGELRMALAAEALLCAYGLGMEIARAWRRRRMRQYLRKLFKSTEWP